MASAQPTTPPASGDGSSKPSDPDYWNSATCLACGTGLCGRYCHHCGQARDTRRLDLSWLAHQLLLGLFSVDRGLLYTLRGLFTQPGRLVRGYIEGVRKPCFPPFTLLLILSTIGVLLASWLNIDFTGATAPLDEEGQAAMSRLNAWLVRNQGIIYLALLPLMAVSTWIMFRSHGHGLIEHVFANAFVSIQVALASIPIYMLLQFRGLAIWASVLGNLLYISLLAWTFSDMYEQEDRVAAVIRVLTAYGIATGLMILVGILVAIIGSALGLL